MCFHVLADLLGLVVPVSHGAVGAQEEHAHAADNQADQRNNEGHSPSLGGSQALVSNQRVEDGRHDEVGAKFPVSVSSSAVIVL